MTEPTTKKIYCLIIEVFPAYKPSYFGYEIFKTKKELNGFLKTECYFGDHVEYDKYRVVVIIHGRIKEQP